MYASVNSMALSGIKASMVTVEAHLSRGLPAMNMVGLPDAAVREAKERVRAAFMNTGLEFPLRRLTINMAPADIRKEGPIYDLPIALAIMCAEDKLSRSLLAQTAVIGELSLQGKVMPVRGALSMAMKAKERGLSAILLPAENEKEASHVRGIEVLAVNDLSDAVRRMQRRSCAKIHSPSGLGMDGDGTTRKGEKPSEEIGASVCDAPPQTNSQMLDMADVNGQEHAKRAIEIACAGGHNILLIGPPGAGKTMLASRVPAIMPPLNNEDALEVTRIYSVVGALGPFTGLIEQRPFRSPHHTMSHIGLIGGGSHARPGEITLAHKGVLFLDELPEYDRRNIEALRQPLEDGVISISRANYKVEYPAQFMLVAAMNPCPCGHLSSSVVPCRCSASDIERYRKKISGPILDRIDMVIEIPALDPSETLGGGTGTSTADLTRRVQIASDHRQQRAATTRTGEKLNAVLTAADIKTFCALGKQERLLMEQACKKYRLSGRGVHKVLKVARTIADLSSENTISCEHLSEALQYRMPLLA